MQWKLAIFENSLLVKIVELPHPSLPNNIFFKSFVSRCSFKGRNYKRKINLICTNTSKFEWPMWAN
jgi:hypothetical protein